MRDIKMNDVDINSSRVVPCVGVTGPWLLISTPRPTTLDNAIGTSTADSSEEQ
ncbi:hypothetical protein E2562_021502, partial [Oryza meyeriana var. granulata]